MAITTPVINKIIRMTEFDLLRTATTKGNMYMCLDSQKLYYDESDSKRTLYYYVGVKTVNDLMYNITPAMNTTYYCWEDNSLWLWMNKWISIYSDSTYPSAYVYDSNNQINSVYRNDEPYLPADDNGLLKDGSVIVRDRQRIIKGKLYIDDGNDNLVISSFLGGGMRFLPNGKMSTQGELYICDDSTTEDSEDIEVNKVALLSYSQSESTVEVDTANLKAIQEMFNENNCKAPKSIEMEFITYNLSNSPNETTDSYIVVYKSTENEKNYFTLINNIHYIPVNGKMIYSYLRSEFHTISNDMYVDYSQNPELDYNLYQKPSHKYKVFHEGNLDASAIHILTAQEIYEKLLDDSLPDPLDFNVTQLQGKTPEDFAPAIHTHVAADITDFNDKAQAQALVVVKRTMDNIDGEGITIKYNDISQRYEFSANEFNLSFNGGATGTGKISHLTDTSITLKVNPDRHVHQNYIDRMDNLQEQIDTLAVFDPDNYYNKNEIDIKIRDVSPTSTPTPGKALAVNEDGILPCPSASANRLTNSIDINFTGDITGTVNTDFHASPVDIALSADKIVSNVATPGKALKLDEQGNLPTNAKTASALNHIITINIEGGAEGTGNLDTSLNSVNINTVLNLPDDVLLDSDIGIKIPSLDEEGRIPEGQLPEMPASLMPKGLWNPNTGAPTKNPEEGYLYVVNSAGTFENASYKINDWCVYMNSKWNHINTNDNVLSVNNKTGIVKLIATDVNAIGLDYINYTLGETIPQNKVVMTSQDGIIEGASVSKLTTPFDLISDQTGDIIFNEDSVNTQTDGLKDLNVKMTLTTSGYTNIKENAVHKIYNDDAQFEYRQKLNFIEGLTVTKDSKDATKLNIGTKGMNIDFVILYYNYTDSTNNLKERLNSLYSNKDNKPIFLIATLQYKEGTTTKTGEFYFIIDKSSPEPAANIAIKSINSYLYDVIDSFGKVVVTDNYSSLNLKFTLDTEVSINILSFASTTNEHISSYLTTSATSSTAPFLPTYDAQPASKKYVDNCFTSRSYKTSIGNGTNTTYTVTHNLNSENIIVQCRMTNTKEECFINNTIVDANTIRLSSTSALTNNQVTVYVWAI